MHELDLQHVARSSEQQQQQSALASALQDRGKAVLLYFHSSACSLCRSVQPLVQQEGDKCRQWLRITPLCTDGGRNFAPEMLNYGVTSVPCFVLLTPGGERKAVAKSGAPRDRAHVTSALQGLLRIAQQQRR